MKLKELLVVSVAMLVLGVFVACGGPTPEQAEAAPPLENGEFTFTHDGVTTRYAIHGSGPVAMVVSNSWGITIEGLRAVYGGMEEYLTLIYFDPRGMGGSSAAGEDSDLSMASVRADLEALRQHLGLGAVNLLGWSNGAMNLMLYAAEHPEACDRIVLLHGVSWNDPGDMQHLMENYAAVFQAWGAFIQQMGDPALAPEAQNTAFKQFLIESWFPHLFADPEAGRTRLEEMFKDTSFSWRHIMYSQNVDSAAFDAREGLKTVTCPTLVIAGAHDMLPPARVEEVANLVAGSEYVVFDDSGHFSMLEEPEKFHAKLKEFLGI